MFALDILDLCGLGVVQRYRIFSFAQLMHWVRWKNQPSTTEGAQSELFSHWLITTRNRESAGVMFYIYIWWFSGNPSCHAHVDWSPVAGRIIACSAIYSPWWLMKSHEVSWCIVWTPIHECLWLVKSVSFKSLLSLFRSGSLCANYVSSNLIAKSSCVSSIRYINGPLSIADGQITNKVRPPKLTYNLVNVWVWGIERVNGELAPSLGTL